MLITELVIVLPVGHIEPHITNWVTKPSQVTWTGNLSVWQAVYVSIDIST